jgi:hypothetical protein
MEAAEPSCCFRACVPPRSSPGRKLLRPMLDDEAEKEAIPDGLAASGYHVPLADYSIKFKKFRNGSGPILERSIAVEPQPKRIKKSLNLHLFAPLICPL